MIELFRREKRKKSPKTIKTVSSPVRVYSEFQPLEEMLVGRPYPEEAFSNISDPDLQSMLRKIMSETEEDCLRLCEILQNEGVTVRRPQVQFDLMDEGGFKKIDIQKWNYTYPNPPLWPRDMTFTLGNQIFSVFSKSPSRWLESWSFYDIFFSYYNQGADWVSMPPPILNLSNKSYVDYEDQAILFHAANIVRCGKDIFHTLPAREDANAKGTSHGLEWIKRQVRGDFRFHAVNRVGHLDGKIALIRPGLLVSWLGKEELPKPLQNWDIIRLQSKGDLPDDFQRLRKNRYYKEFVKGWLNEWIGYVDETYFDVNLISINENLVLTNGKSEFLTAELNKRGVETIPFDFRHRYFWDGGLHCITLDIRRKGDCEDYSS